MRQPCSPTSWWSAGVLGLLCMLTVPTVQAQVWAVEGLPWQFQTATDKNSKAVTLDIIERKKGGYYDSFKTTYNVTNNTWIERQYNCDQTSAATGSTANNSMESAVSSPVTSNTSGNYLDAIGNTSNTDVQDHGPTGVLGRVAGRSSADVAGGSSADTSQTNSGDVTSRVRSSPSDAFSGPLNADHGRSDQVLDVDQANTGNQTARISGSACAFGSGGYTLN